MTLDKGSRFPAAISYSDSARPKSLRFYDQKAVIALLDRLPQMDETKRTEMSLILTEMVSACVLQERFKLTQ